MDARHLGLRDASLDRVFAVGLFHHLSDDDAVQTLQEARRVMTPDGQLVVVDLIPPVSRTDVLGWILVRLDRGRHVRTADGYRRLIASQFLFSKDYRIRTGPYDLCVFVLRPRI